MRKIVGADTRGGMGSVSKTSISVISELQARVTGVASTYFRGMTPPAIGPGDLLGYLGGGSSRGGGGDGEGGGDSGGGRGSGGGGRSSSVAPAEAGGEAGSGDTGPAAAGGRGGGGGLPSGGGAGGRGGDAEAGYSDRPRAGGESGSAAGYSGRSGAGPDGGSPRRAGGDTPVGAGLAALLGGSATTGQLVSLGLALANQPQAWAAMEEGNTLTFTPHVRQGGSGAELDIYFDVRHLAPTDVRTGNVETLSRVANHHAVTTVDLQPLDLFSLSSFGMETSTGRRTEPVPVLG